MHIKQGCRLQIILPANELCNHNKDIFEIILCDIHVTELLINKSLHKLPKWIFLPLGKNFWDMRFYHYWQAKNDQDQNTNIYDITLIMLRLNVYAQEET